ncbi:MAG: sensor histidine kinase [Proteobacteria bacterium]|nr:sensor histidine kinase [Pseudomonadota bacterium]
MQWSSILREWFRPAPDSAVSDNVRLGKSPYTDWVHLLWSIWIFVTPLFDHGLAGYTRTWLAFTLATYPVFLFLYAMLLVASRRRTAWFALGMVALCFATMHWYPSGISYFMYGCIFLYHCRMSVRRYLGALILINAAFVFLGWRAGYPAAMLVLMPSMVFIICTIVMVEHMGKQRDAAWALSQEEVRRLAATAERERIGRDLHDLLGHTLSLITLKLELSRKLLDRDGEAARRELEEAERVARHALSQVRSAVSGIRATDIAAELASARLLLESCGAHLEYELPQMDLPPEIEHGLSLVLREAVTNIARHAGASIARIELARDPSAVRMQVADNGRGGVERHGNGLSGIGERVRALKGSLAIESVRSHGTTLRICVPVPALRLVSPLSSPLLRTEDAAGTGPRSGQSAA